jgi:hypothetical protein
MIGTIVHVAFFSIFILSISTFYDCARWVGLYAYVVDLPSP